MTRPRPSPPGAVRWITRTLEEAGFETWAVGGAVRDALLGQASVDWDLTTKAHPGDVRRLFKRTVPIGVEHGTVGVLAKDGTMYEVTTFRKDVETDGRHAVVEFAERVEDDLARRDFTMNSMAWHAMRDELLDPYGGLADLEAGIVRTVGEPTERFAEDYLRVLRALRFAGRFGFRIHEDTWRALSSVTEHLPGLSAERIREELMKVLDADPHPSTSLHLYRESGVMGVLFPALAALSDDVWAQTSAVLDHLPPQRPVQRLAALLHPLVAEERAGILLRLRLSNAQVDETARRAAAPPLPATGSDAEIRRWLSRVGVGRLSAVARLELARARVSDGSADEIVARWAAARRVRAQRPPLAVTDLAFDGRDLIGLGLKPGPDFGDILDHLLEWVLADPARNQPSLLEAEALRVVRGPEQHGADV